MCEGIDRDILIYMTRTNEVIFGKNGRLSLWAVWEKNQKNLYWERSENKLFSVKRQIEKANKHSIKMFDKWAYIRDNLSN